MPFDPSPGQPLLIEGVTYTIASHPAAPGMPYGQAGRAGTVYQIVGPDGPRALKVFKSRFRTPSLVTQADQITPYASLPGLRACQRTVLTPSRQATLLRQHPDLIYAVLMPWIDGSTWQEIVQTKQALTEVQALALARAFLGGLTGMEERGLAHCDLSGGNVMLALTPFPSPNIGRGEGGEGSVELVDLEGLFGPGVNRPEYIASGSPGYAHKSAAAGVWGTLADRFAGALLTAEMVGWCDPAVRQAAWGESYFQPDDLQGESARLQTLLKTLHNLWGDGAAELLLRAWRSDTLSDCPTFGEWLVALPEKVPLRTPVSTVVDLTAGADQVGAGKQPNAVQALIQVAESLQQRGSLEAAEAVYRQAFALATSAQSVEIEARLAALEKQRQALPVKPVAEPARQAAPAPTVVQQDGFEQPYKDDLNRLFRDGLSAYKLDQPRKALELFGEIEQRQPGYCYQGQSAKEWMEKSKDRLNRLNAPLVKPGAWPTIRFLILWTLATIPLVFASFSTEPIYNFVYNFYNNQRYFIGERYFIGVLKLTFFCVTPLLGALFQWLVLKHILLPFKRWIGWSFRPIVISLLFDGFVSLSIILLQEGIRDILFLLLVVFFSPLMNSFIMGLCQWWVLRGFFHHAQRWLVTYVICLPVLRLYINLTNLAVFRFPDNDFLLLISIILILLSPGLLTGWALLRLPRRVNV